MMKSKLIFVSLIFMMFIGLYLLGKGSLYVTLQPRMRSSTNDIQFLSGFKQTSRNRDHAHKSTSILNNDIVLKDITAQKQNNFFIKENGFLQIEDGVAWLFSAFFDSINDTVLVRVFGIQECSRRYPVTCYVIHGGGVERTTVAAICLSNHHSKRFCVMSYECILPSNLRPEFVSLTFSKAANRKYYLPVHYPQPVVRNLTVCFSILFRFDRYAQLIQNIETGRVLGAQHFFVYNFSVMGAANSALKFYQRLGLLTVIQWPLPDIEVPYFGQLLAINDCVYRNRGASRLVAIHDTDEIVIPTHRDTLYELISDIDQDFRQRNRLPRHENSVWTSPRLGTYIFQHFVFSGSQRALPDGNIGSRCSNSLSEERLLRRHALTLFTNLHCHNVTALLGRTKVIVRPELILFSEVHFTHSHRPLAESTKVDFRWAKLHHLRHWAPLFNGVPDLSACKFKNKTLFWVNNTFYKLNLL